MSLACYEIHKTKFHFKNASRIFHMLVCFYNSTFKGDIFFVLLMLIPEHTKLYLIFFTFVTSWAISNSEVHHLCNAAKFNSKFIFDNIREQYLVIFVDVSTNLSLIKVHIAFSAVVNIILQPMPLSH